MFEASILGTTSADLTETSTLARELEKATSESFLTVHGNAERNMALAQKLRALRNLREEMFGPRLFSDPAWDVLLTLYLSKLQQARLKVTSVIEESGVPPTTVLRWIAALSERGLIVRSTNPTDLRSCLVELSDEAAAMMTNYLEQFHKGACAG